MVLSLVMWFDRIWWMQNLTQDICYVLQLEKKLEEAKKKADEEKKEEGSGDEDMDSEAKEKAARKAEKAARKAEKVRIMFISHCLI